MAKIEVRTFSNPDETRVFEKGRADIVTLGDVTIGRTIAEPGWRWSEHIRPLAGTMSCQLHHLGFVVRGRIRVQLDDGTAQEMGPADIYDIPPGHDAWVVGDEDAEIFDWAGAMGTFAKPAIEAADRLLTTLLFTDIVGSTSIAERIGDTEWRQLLAQHNSVVRRELDRYRGREVATTGDGFLAMFDSAARAVRCAASICAAVQSLELTVRTAVHTGEVELVAGDVRGLAVHAAARIGQLADAGEVLVSATTFDLLQASGLRFEERGTHELRGISGSRAIYRYVGEAEPTALTEPRAGRP